MSTPKKFVLVGAALAAAAVPLAAQAGPPPSCKKTNNCPTVKKGRMTGHGQVFNYAGFAKVQWEFRNSICQANKFPDLKVEFGGNKFILKSYNAPGLVCLDTPADEGQPKAGFDTITASGTGTLNGAGGAGIRFRFTDAGEPGTSDTASFTITKPNGDIAIVVDNVAIQDGGNHQAHK
jgi:hypothetical protein